MVTHSRTGWAGRSRNQLKPNKLLLLMPNPCFPLPLVYDNGKGKHEKLPHDALLIGKGTITVTLVNGG